MSHEALEINKDNIAIDSYLSVLANLMERYNQALNDENYTFNLDTNKKILQDINEGFSLYAQLKNTVLDQDVSTVTVLKQDLETLISQIQQKLTNGDFVGTPGTTDYNNLENKPSLFSGNYADLSNKPFIPLNVDQMEDYEEGTWIPTLIGSVVEGVCDYTSLRYGKYVKNGNTITLSFIVGFTNHTGEGGMQISNIPFLTGSVYSCGTVSTSNVSFDGNIVLECSTNSDRINISQNKNNSPFSLVPIQSNITFLIGNITYIV